MCLFVEYAVKHVSLEPKTPPDLPRLSLANLGLLFAVPSLTKRFFLHPPNISEQDRPKVVPAGTGGMLTVSRSRITKQGKEGM